MTRKVLTTIALVVGFALTAILVASSIWPVVNVVETGKTPEYPNIRPQYYSADPARVFDAARDSIRSAPQFSLASTSRSDYTIRATHETDIFGFVDDVTVWVEPVTEFVTRVRVRSASRIGKGDFGQNARNIRKFFRALDKRLGGMKFDPERLERSGGDEPPAKKTSTDAGPPSP